ncbi:hypothetical protein [Naasia aerilata]|uniref:Uncharacterized protein n=1 Tax=Naasia aerilata TaxID=1162966 RepID=A0ABN6XKR9_9MICO|nr:hypothetical protein [Naasia aerilata]BDZ45550.1 hypothetical protein GCM10025866_14590 [Naasia aerilata]
MHIPPLSSGPGVDILFSPGMPVQWTQLEVGGETNDESPASHASGLDDFPH